MVNQLSYHHPFIDFKNKLSLMPLKPTRLARVLPTRDQACRFLDPTMPNGMVMTVIMMVMMMIILIIIIMMMVCCLPLFWPVLIIAFPITFHFINTLLNGWPLLTNFSFYLMMANMTKGTLAQLDPIRPMLVLLTSALYQSMKTLYS